MVQYTREQRFLYMTFIIGGVACTMCSSLLGPLLPREAESKGATPLQYGIVFGIRDFVMFVMSFVMGNFVSQMGPTFLTSAGLFLSGGTCVLFGQLDRFIHAHTFLNMAIVIRIIGAIGEIAFYVPVFSILTKEFPENSASMFSTLYAFFGLGNILGPIVGTALYSIGGFTLPFTVLGTCLVSSTVVAYIFIPDNTEENTITRRGLLLQALKIKPIVFKVLVTSASTLSVGCIQVGLEPHLRPLGLNPFEVGVVFAIYSITLCIAAPFWGILIDRWISPNTAIIIGGVLIVVAFLLLGPAPFFDLRPNMWMIIVGLIVFGIGWGGETIGPYVGAQRDAIVHGMPDSIITFGVISGLWHSGSSLGAFLGPIVTGYVIEEAGFRWATQVVVVVQFIIVAFLVAMECIENAPKKTPTSSDTNLTECQPLVQ